MNNNLKHKIKYPSQIAAVIVTYNRLELLKKVVNGLRQQTRKINQIFVINNSSTDGTLEWLNAQSDIITITQPNTGSSGGQYTGAKAAYEAGYEWIWQMDDDVVADEKCLENLLKYCKSDLVVTPARLEYNKPIRYDIVKMNLTNPLKGLNAVMPCENDFNKDMFYVEGFTLEGPMFHYSMFEKAGFVNEKFFILADDTEYSIRLNKKGIKAAIIPSAVLHRQIPLVIAARFDWKTYYYMRNIILIDVIHGTKAVRFLRPLKATIWFLIRARSFSDIKTVFKSLRDGYFYKKYDNE